MINWPRVKELREEVGAEDFDEVVELFLEEVEGVISKLRTNDRSALEQDLHFLKGSAMNLGFDDFSSLCMTGERQSAEGAAASVDLAAVVTSYEQSKADFLSKLPALA
ncbi:Hpt domain-containing protein [Phaeobacter sp. QD34_3]|uniref:Hpt domain-containing protein n=1 Tax=unclassified Phaeobacter TaxID=2621772 RepID=UPI00237FA507|nr:MULTISPECIES: Hpt domain-containing protein [unclassified Phaeobacter]MDE4134381.1 Hpt domain-containing protein [Phaeobacter sp. QD34_3]MDE4137714.1 Hpt domain-containing protein [Phaeobacter sp. QD34_24]